MIDYEDMMSRGNEGSKEARVTAKRKRIALVDGNSYIHRAYHAIRDLRNSRGLPTNAVYGFLNMLVKVLREEKPDLAAVVFDAGGKTFRHDLFPDYKANRPRMADDLAVQLDYIKRLTAAFGLTAVEREGVEADDILATLGKQARERGLDVLYITGDKDIHQLIDDHTTALDTMKEKRVGLESFRAERGFDPGRLPEVMALEGDATDNIPGVRGIGRVTAEKLIREYGSLEEIYRRLDDMPEGKVKEALKEHRPQAEMSRELARLKDDLTIEADWVKMADPRPDKKALKALLEELEFKKFLRELDLDEEDAAGGETRAAAPEAARVAPAAWAGKFDRSRPTALGLSRPDGGADGEAFLALTQDGVSAAVVRLAPAAGGGVPDPVRRLLADGGAAKAVFDLKGVAAVLGKSGLSLEGAGTDVLIVGYLLNPSEKGDTLEDLAQSWLGSSAFLKDEAEAAQGALFQPAEARERRAVREAVAVLRLARRLGPELAASGMEKLYLEVEMPLVAVLGDMEAVGIGVDTTALREMSKELETTMGGMEARIHALAGTSFNLGSPKQLAEVLFVKLGLPAVKKTKTGLSTDEEVLTALAARHELPSLLLSHRQLAKLKNTYVDVLPGLVSPADGRLHTSFNQAVTATGRLSSSNPNLQNIPVRTEWGMRIRKAFVPRPGWKFISADYSQIELRVLAHLSGDEALVEAFRKGEDIHARTATAIFNVPPEGVTKEMRRAAKVINFGIIYGMSPYGLSRELGVDQKQSKRYIEEYFEAYGGVRRYLDELVAGAKKDGYVTTLFGRRRFLKELLSDKPQIVQFAERAALNTPIQGTAADLIKMAMVRLHRELSGKGWRTRLLVQIHDELLLESPPGELDRAGKLVRECMEKVASFNVPIVVDVSTGDNWGDLH